MAAHPPIVVIDGPLVPADVPGICQRVGRALAEGQGLICDVAGVTQVDACTVDALARLQLAARRHGCRIGLMHASAELRALLALMGLDRVVPCVDPAVPCVEGSAGGKPRG